MDRFPSVVIGHSAEQGPSGSSERGSPPGEVTSSLLMIDSSVSFGLESQLSLIVIVAVPIVRNGMRVRVELTFCALIETLANRLLPSDLENPSQSFTVIVGELCTRETFRL
jgi:hypothetical protein